MVVVLVDWSDGFMLGVMNAMFPVLVVDLRESFAVSGFF